MLNFEKIVSLLAKLKPVDKEKLRREKLEQLFKVNNEVRCLRTGRLFQVYDVILGEALMIGSANQVVKASWISSAGRLRTEVADSWELVHNAALA